MPNKPSKVNRPWVREHKPFERERKPDAFDYNGRKWRNLRAAFLKENPLCCMCEAEGMVIVATVVDHIKRVADGGAGYDKSNLQPLCKKHHDAKSGRERHNR